MNTSISPLLDLLSHPKTQYVVPAYQRAYAWTEKQCEDLWIDLLRAAKTGEKHFLGTLLYAQEMPRERNSIARRSIIDGQQRLATTTLLLVALARHLDRATDADLPVCPQFIRNTYLGASSVAHQTPARKIRLVLSRKDASTLRAVIDNAEVPADASERILANLAFFERKMADDDFDAAALWRGLESLRVIEAATDENDSSQLIFESLNSKGVPLSTADLVRNYLLLAESHREQTRLYDEYWAPIEGMFTPDPGSLRLDNAIQGWLTVRFRRIRAKGASEVYGVFKRYVEEDFEGTTEILLHELRNFCLVWAENYRYHAVKKYRSSFDWATNGAKTLVSHLTAKKASDESYATKIRDTLAEIDESL